MDDCLLAENSPRSSFNDSIFVHATSCHLFCAGFFQRITPSAPPPPLPPPSPASSCIHNYFWRSYTIAAHTHDMTTLMTYDPRCAADKELSCKFINMNITWAHWTSAGEPKSQSQVEEQNGRAEKRRRKKWMQRHVWSSLVILCGFWKSKWYGKMACETVRKQWCT